MGRYVDGWMDGYSGVLFYSGKGRLINVVHGENSLPSVTGISEESRVMCTRIMATRILSSLGPQLHKGFRLSVNTLVSLNTKNYQSVSTTIVGNVPTKPRRPRLSLTKVSICMGIGIFVGQLIAKRFAAFMEETELFVPDDDDD